MTGSEQPKERTRQALADGFEPLLVAKLVTKKSRVNLNCESEDESILLAHELRERGYKASSGAALTGKTVHDLKGSWVVVVEGPKREKRT